MGESDHNFETGGSPQSTADSNVSADIWRTMNRQLPAKLGDDKSQTELDFSKGPVLYAQNAGSDAVGGQQDARTGQQGAKSENTTDGNYSQDVMESQRHYGGGVELLDGSKSMSRTAKELDIIKQMLAKGGLSNDDQLRAAQVLINNKIDSFTDAKGQNYKIELTNTGDRQNVKLLSGADGRNPIIDGSLSNTGNVLELRVPARQSQDKIMNSTDRGFKTQLPGDDYSKKVVEFHRNMPTGDVEVPDASKAMLRTTSELRAIQDVIANKESSSGDKLRAAQLLAHNNVDSMKVNGVDYKIELSTATNNESVKLMQVTDGKSTELLSGQLTRTGELLDANGQKIPLSDASKQGQPTDKQVQPGDGRRPPGADNPQPYQGKPLFNPALTPEERIKEADRMYKNGERTVTGPDGKVYQISEAKVGNRTLVGVFGQDDRGRPVPILRGVVEQDGKVSQQRDSKGKPVDIVSDYGKKNPDSPLVKHEKPPERNERPPRQEDPANEKPSDKVKRLAEKLEPPEDRQKFLTDMQKFEERAKRDNIPQEEVDKTYREMARLMEAQEGKVTAADRQLLAKNLMYHLADPTNIDQGQHNTCNVTTIAERMATRNPSKLVEMATTTALTGQWTAPDGKVIKIDPGSLVPGGEENRHPPVDGARSFATQLLNLTMVNDIKQREMPPKFYRQERPSGSNQDTGERLYYENGQKADGKVPGVDINQMSDFLKRTTGDTGVLVVDKEHATPDMVSINSPEELAAKLKQMKAEGKMPPILLIDANDKLFFNGPADKRNWHVVSITGYDERTGMVTISNQWGKPQDRQIPLADLYRAMNPGRPQPPARPRTN